MELAGREAELGSLAAVLDGVAVGTSHLIGVVGEAGIGKTRLAQEAVELADQPGFVTLSGRAPPRELAVAYGPIVEALSEHLRSLDIVARAAMTSGLPELATLFGSLVPGRAEPLADLELEQARLFEAIARLLERIQDEAPVLFVVDDAHEADTASLALLHYLCRRLDHQRVLTLLIYRNDADSLRPLRELHSTMRRQGRLDEIALEPLRRNELADLVARSLDGPPVDPLIDLLAARAGGVPVIRESLEVFERLGAGPCTGEARQALRKLGVTPPRRARSGPGELSPREREVACLAAEGMTSTRIAEPLVISPHTVRPHLKRIHERLGLSSRAELTRHVIDAGWLADTTA